MRHISLFICLFLFKNISFQKYLFAYMQLLKQSTQVIFFSKESFLKLNKENYFYYLHISLYICLFLFKNIYLYEILLIWRNKIGSIICISLLNFDLLPAFLKTSCYIPQRLLLPEVRDSKSVNKPLQNCRCPFYIAGV